MATSSAADSTPPAATAPAAPSGSQLAYNGHLLYIFMYDRPGQVNGQDFQDFFVVTPGGGYVAS